MILVALSLELTDIFEMYVLSKQISCMLQPFCALLFLARLLSPAWSESQLKKKKETLMKLCMTILLFEKLFLLQKLGNGAKIGFLNLKKNLVINLH